MNERTDHVYVADGTGAVVVLDGETNRMLARVPVGPHPARLIVDAALNRVYVTDPDDGTVWLLQELRFGSPTVHVFARSDEVSVHVGHALDECGC